MLNVIPLRHSTSNRVTASCQTHTSKSTSRSAHPKLNPHLLPSNTSATKLSGLLSWYLTLGLTTITSARIYFGSHSSEVLPQKPPLTLHSNFYYCNLAPELSPWSPNLASRLHRQCSTPDPMHSDISSLPQKEITCFSLAQNFAVRKGPKCSAGDSPALPSLNSQFLRRPKLSKPEGIINAQPANGCTRRCLDDLPSFSKPG